MHRLTASVAAERIRAGELTSESRVRAYLARIAVRETEVGAWQHLDSDLALQQARAADRSPSRGPLHGVPIGVQLIARRGEDELLLRVGEWASQALAKQ